MLVAWFGILWVQLVNLVKASLCFQKFLKVFICATCVITVTLFLSLDFILSWDGSWSVCVCVYPQPTCTWWRAAEPSRSACVVVPTGQTYHPSPLTRCPRWAQSLQTQQQQCCLGYHQRADGGDSCDGDADDAWSCGDGEVCYCSRSCSLLDSVSGRRWRRVWWGGRHTHHPGTQVLSAQVGLKERQRQEHNSKFTMNESTAASTSSVPSSSSPLLPLLS